MVKISDSYIIFFCTFDPFGKGLCKYTFENTCLEMPELKLGDKCTKIFFNTKGVNKETVNSEQRAFIEYVECGKPTSELTEKIDARVREIRENKKWRREYMKTLTHDQDIRDEVQAKNDIIIHEKDLALAEKDAKLLEQAARLSEQAADISNLKETLNILKKMLTDAGVSVNI